VIRRLAFRTLSLSRLAIDVCRLEHFGEAAGQKDVVDAHSPAPMECSSPVIPPRKGPRPFGIGFANGIGKAPSEDVLQSVALSLAYMRCSNEFGDIPNVAIFWCNVEISRDDKGIISVATLIELSAQALEPSKLGYVLF